MKRWLAALAFGIATPSVSEVVPASRGTDPRIRTILYDPHDVVEIVGHLGYATTVFFAGGERIQSIALGDDAWHVVPEGDRVSIKPRGDRLMLDGSGFSESDTNMTVFTERRAYFFELRTSRNRDPVEMTYAVHFVYPVEASPTDTEIRRVRGQRRLSTGSSGTVALGVAEIVRADRRNWNYSWSGSAALKPTAVFDDGRFTYLRMPGGRPLPAFYHAEVDGQETIANFHIVGNWIVIHHLSPHLILRDGRLVTCVFRDERSR